MNSNSNIIHWGIIGGGKVVQHKSGLGFNIEDKSRVVAVMRRNMADAIYTANSLGATKGYTDLATFLVDTEIDAVYIATPPGLHYQQALACLDAEKAVYVEKPFTIQASQAADLVEKFAAKKTPLFVAHYRRALPKFRKARELIESKIGTPLEFELRLTRNIATDLGHPWLFDPILGGGKFFDIAPHYLDILIYFFGHITATQTFVRHVKSPNNGADIVKMVLSHASGVIGTANFNFVSNQPSDKLSIYGTNGELHFSVADNGDILWKGFESAEETFCLPFPACVQAPMILEVVNYLLEKTGNPCFGQDALETMRIIENSLKNFGRSSA